MDTMVIAIRVLKINNRQVILLRAEEERNMTFIHHKICVALFMVLTMDQMIET